MLASAVHNVAKYYQKVLENTEYQRPKRSSNKIRILQTMFEFGKKTNLTSLQETDSKKKHIMLRNCYTLNVIHINKK